MELKTKNKRGYKNKMYIFIQYLNQKINLIINNFLYHAKALNYGVILSCPMFFPCFMLLSRFHIYMYTFIVDWRKKRFA